MQPFFEDYLAHLAELHSAIQRAIEGLPSAALDWSPGPELNSLAALIVHLAGAERFWIGDVAMGESSNRNRPAEFQVHSLEASELIGLVAASLDYARGALERLALADLAAPRTSPRDGRAVTVAWALFHALKHTALHLGHIEITRQLWEQQAKQS
jgi:uncharacterized damage-inducible protein DinB